MMRVISYIVAALVLTGLVRPAPAQEVLVPDPGLNAAIREALQKPSGPLTEQELTTLVLSEPLAATNLAATVGTLRSRGVAVFTYPLTVQLLRPRALVGAFEFGITGPPGVYAVLASADLVTWSQLGVASNQLGSVSFTDGTTHLSPRKFYRTQPVIPPTNRVLIPPGTVLRTL